MAFQVSLSIQVKEIDLSNVVPTVSLTRGAFNGVFQWGPVDEVKTVSDAQNENIIRKFVSRYAALGNSIKVSVCASSNAYFDNAVDAVNL